MSVVFVLRAVVLKMSTEIKTSIPIKSSLIFPNNIRYKTSPVYKRNSLYRVFHLKQARCQHCRLASGRFYVEHFVLRIL